jgi:NAD(P)-dependent dehydrogenase (short-subunit alcohol dehydrogenase family)
MAERFENGYGGLVAVVTGGGTGMGRELVRQLTAQGCDVAACDVISENLAETVAICTADGNSGQILTHIADVSIETEVLAFRDAVAKWRPHVHVLLTMPVLVAVEVLFLMNELAGTRHSMCVSEVSTTTLVHSSHFFLLHHLDKW